jgi:hypothetical protein
MKVNIKFKLWLFSSLFSLLVAGLGWVLINHYQKYINMSLHPRVGIKPSTVAALREHGLSFSFLVIGDLHSSEIGENLIEIASQKGSPSFMVILGDFVRHPDVWHHRFFLMEMTQHINPSFPVFLVSGNHDMDNPPLKIEQSEDRVTPEIYESFYGPLNFDFTFNNCLFIICGFDRKDQYSYLGYLRDTLIKKGEGKKYIFVFIHVPPKGLFKNIDTLSPQESELYSLLETYKVTTCFFGHRHGYLRIQRNGVNYIISAGGGGTLRGEDFSKEKFHHILRVNVEREKVTEEIMPIMKITSVESLYEEWFFTRLLQIIKKIKVFLYVLSILFSVWGLYSCFKFSTYFLKKDRRNTHGTPVD